MPEWEADYKVPIICYEPCECGHEWQEHSWQPRSDLPAPCNKCLCSDYDGDHIDTYDPEDESA